LPEGIDEPGGPVANLEPAAIGPGRQLEADAGQLFGELPVQQIRALPVSAGDRVPQIGRSPQRPDLTAPDVERFGR